MKTTYMVSPFALATLGALLTFCAFACAPMVSGAQGQGGGGNGSGDQDRIQEQDRVQDPTTHDGDEPLQDRDQMRDRDGLQATTSTSGTPIRDQDRLRDQDQVQDPTTHDGDEPLQDRDQTRDRDRVHVTTPVELETLIDEESATADEETQSLGEEMRELARKHNRVRVATMAFMAVENMVGPVGPEMAQVAEEVNAEVETMQQTEERMQSRSRFTRFFFGSNGDDVAALEGALNQNRVRIEKLNRYMNDCECDEETRTMLMEQLRAMEEEQERLGILLGEEKGSKGIFGRLFGWL